MRAVSERSALAFALGASRISLTYVGRLPVAFGSAEVIGHCYDLAHNMTDSMSSLRPMGHSARGFTLGELLVVIAIIGVLTGALMPALAAARGKARLTTCMSNLRQIAVGVSIYADASEEVLPVVEFSESYGSAHGTYIHEAIEPYLGNGKVFK